MVHLQGGVVDVVVLPQPAVQIDADGVAVGVGEHEDVRGQCRLPGGDLPDVEIVDFADTGPAGHGGTDAVRVDPVRRGLEKNPAGSA